MEPISNLSDFLNSNSNDSGGKTAPGLELADFTAPKPVQAQAPQPGKRLNPADVDAIAGREGLSDTQRRMLTTLLEQESGAGANARTSVDGARGAGQVMPDTFKQYAKPGERIDDPNANVAVAARIIKDLGQRHGDDPAKIATGYFSGAGNVNAGQGSAWKQDHADGNGKKVSAYVSDVLGKLGIVGNAQAATTTGPDLGKAPKWADVEAKPEFKALSPDDQAKAKTAYFDYWIAPSAGARAPELRTQFLAARQPELGAQPGSFAEGVKGQPLAQSTAPSRAPVAPEVRAKFNAMWDGATPEQRTAMAARPGWTGQLARERAGLFDNPAAAQSPLTGTDLAKKFDPRVEARRDTLVNAGEDPRFAAVAAQQGAGMGIVPGQEVQALGGTAQPSSFDFDTKGTFDPSQSANGLNNVLGRGLAKGGLGLAKAATGYGEFLSDVMGTDAAGATLRQGSAWARGKEDAIGEHGTMVERNLEGAINSIAQQLPLMLTGVKLESEAVPLAGIAVTSFGQEYSDGRAKGQTVGQAATRAAIFAAFEVIGEKFGLHSNMEGIKAAARGLPADKVAAFFVEALKKEVPGELLTTTGQFATDKFAPAGVGLTPNATMSDYMASMADTFVQTLMQGGLMAGGGAALSAGARRLNQGQQQPVPLQRIEPAMGDEAAVPPAPADPVRGSAPAPHPTVQTADQIVAEMAQQHGLPLDTVLPVAAAPMPTAPAQVDGGVTDQDVASFANARLEQLQAKRDGRVEDVMTDAGPSTTDVPGEGLSPREEHELRVLERDGNNLAALRGLYGFEHPQPVEDKPAAQEPAPEASAAEPPALDASWEQELADLEAQAEREAIQAADAPAVQQQGDPDADIPFDVPATPPAPPPAPAPKTEKEAKQRKALERIAKGTAYFGSQAKATAWVTDNGLGDTHHVIQHASGANRWDIVPKEQTHVQDAPQAAGQPAASNPLVDRLLGKAQPQAAAEAGPGQSGTGSSAGGVPAAGPADAQADGVSEDAPAARWTRMPTADRAALALQLGIKPPHAGNMADRAWDRIDPVVQERLAKAMDKPSKPAATVKESLSVEPDLVAMFDEVLAEEVAKDAPLAEQPKTEKQAKEQRTATEATASAAKNSAAALNAAIDGLGALLGGTPGKLQSGIGFDEDTYAKAKPLFQQALANLGDAKADIKEAMRAVVRMVLDKFGAQAVQNMKPFVVRFIEEISTDNQAQVSDNSPKAKEQTDAVRAEEVPAGSGAQDQPDGQPGTADRQPVDAGVAADGAGAGQDQRVPGSSEGAGAAGAPGAGRVDGDTSGPARNRAGKRTDAGTAEPLDHVVEAGEIGTGGLAKKFKDNIAAITVLKAMEAEGRVATPAERKTLAKYVGWGALKGAFDHENKAWSKQHAELKELLTPEEFKAARASTLDAHYTSPEVVGAMFDAIGALGVTRGRFLEPSVGIGNFFGLMPAALRKASQLHGVELDSLTSRMVAALYPTAKIAKATGFQDFDVPGGYFDVVIGNPPFGQQPTVDQARSPYSGFSVHNYFLAKGIDKLRPGGVMAVVVSHNFLDAQDDRARKWIGDRADLIGAVRLPNDAFLKNAGTQVVTDILLFQKRDGTSAPADVAPWQAVVEQHNQNPKTGDTATHKVNALFAARPDLVLGTPTAGGTMYGANEYTVKADGDITEQLASWVKTLPKDVFHNIDRTQDMARADAVVPDGVKEGSFFLDAAGKVMRRGSDEMGAKTAIPWEGKSEAAIGRMKGMIGLRDALRTQMRLERSVDSTDAEIEANRATLNKLYDDFLKKYKHVNSVTNRSIFLDDTEGNLVQALEFDYDKGVSQATAEKEDIEAKEPSAKKADIFNRRVAFPPQDFMTVESAKDALLASLNFKGRLDGTYMSQVYGKPVAEIIKELGDVVFDDPQHGLVTADEYLSGDVKTKLAEAKEAGPSYARNVAALESVIPKDKLPSEIHVGLGAMFVPASYYDEFSRHISGAGLVAGYVKALGLWVTQPTGTPDAALNKGRFGTEHLSAQELMDLTMLGKGAVVKRTYKNPDGSSTTVVLEKETEAAREKQNLIKQEWQKWVWGDAARADELARIYNDTMNRTVLRKYDGSHLTFPGMNPAFALLEHQKNGVWRGLQSFRMLLDHVVGAGKTFQMATLAMEQRRLGIARKPLFAVPNHLTLQWRDEFTRLYPGSNILAATPEDFAKDKRERMFSKIITGDWDAVIIGHSSLKKFGLPLETEMAVVQEQVDEIAEAVELMKRQRGDKRIVSDMERIRKTLEAKMKEKQAAIGKRSKVLTFDELGVDAMFVDEMHEFKNLTYNTTMDRNPGMGNPAGSGKAFDMFVKVRWLFDTFGDKTPFITATGTPVSNSLVEMFNMQRYMQYPTLKEQGLNVFDAWARQFGSVENVYEVAPSGSGYRQSSRFAKFTNLPALMGLYNSFADTVTLDDLKAQEEAQGKRFPVPKIQGGRPTLVVAKRSPLVAELMGVYRAQMGEDGQVQFNADLSKEVEFKPEEKSGKVALIVGGEHKGLFETEQDARMKLVELALTPKVSVSPESILGRFSRLRELTKQTKGKVNALSLTGEANKAGLDMRLVNPAVADFAGSKINLAVDRMLKVYHQWTADKGAQLVFCDMSIPLSARASYANKARKLYLRDDGGMVTLKRGTMHTAKGQEELPFFVVQRGEKEAKRFDVYDAASGVQIAHNFNGRQDAIDAAAKLLADEANRQAWIDKREQAGDLEQGAIDDYNSENDVETEDMAGFFTREDIAGVSGAAGFSVYDDIKAKLIAKGVPEREIAFIHDFSSPVAKAKLFKAVNAGDVRFLLGSTPKMGAGTNVQERLVGLHHIDAPWRPSDLEQREGRIIRRGNKLYERNPDGFEVFIGRYATEQTYDTRRWQILEHKARGIEQLRNYDGTTNEIEDIDGEAATSADMKAAASGDPLILEETKLRTEAKRLERLQAAHADEVLAMSRRAQYQEGFATKEGPALVAKLKDTMATAAMHPLDEEGFAPVQVEGHNLAKTKEEAFKALQSAFERVRNHMANHVVITYRGLTFNYESRMLGGVSLQSPTGTAGNWGEQEPFSPSGMLQRLNNYVARLDAHVSDTQAEIAKAKENAKALRKQAGEPFAQEGDLAKAREDYKKVQRQLLAKGPEVPENQKALVRDAIDAQKIALRDEGYGQALDEFMGTGAEIKFNAQDGQDGYTAGHEEEPATQPTTPQKTERSARNIRELHRAVVDYLRNHGRTGVDNLQPYLPVNVRGAQEVAEIAKAFNTEVQWFELKEGLTPQQLEDFAWFNGANFGGVQYLRATGTTRPHLAILGHELAHQMAKGSPDLYNEFVEAVNAYIKPGAFAKFLNTPVARKADSPREEFSGEVLSDLFMERDFWEALGVRRAGLLTKVADMVQRLVDKLMATVGYKKASAPYLSDFRKVMEIAQDVMVRYANEKAQPNKADDLQFNRQDTIEVDGVTRPTTNSQGQPLAGNDQATRNFWRWFGDSKVVDKHGRPMLVFHGTTSDFSNFSADFAGEGHGAADWGDGFYFTNASDAANGYAQGDGGAVMPVYLKIDKPARNRTMLSQRVQSALDDGMGFKTVDEVLADSGHDGIAFTHKDGGIEFVVHDGAQIKSAIGNDGTFGPGEDISFNAQDDHETLAAKLRAIPERVRNNLIQFFGSRGDNLHTFTGYDRTLATQYHKALKDKHFGKVFALANAMQNHVSLASIRPAELALGVLPRVDNVMAAAKALVKGASNSAPVHAAARAVFAGTLHGDSVLQGRVWSDDQLRNRFGLDDTAVALYRQTRAAIDASLEEVAAAEAFSLVQGMMPKTIRRELIDHPQAAEGLVGKEIKNQIRMTGLAIKAARKEGDEQRAAELEASQAALKQLNRKLETVFTTAKNLKLAGYAPLMRFGKYQVSVRAADPVTGNLLRDDDGEVMTHFMGRYETQAEAKLVHAQMLKKFGEGDDVQIKIGLVAETAHELFAGISPETMALFAEALGAAPVMRKYIEEALSERSALKRRLERAGTAGFSEDMPRVLSSFITSNGRYAAQRYFAMELNQAIKYIPRAEKGDVFDEAMALKKYVMDPKDPAAPVSTALFAWFLGGSVASALVNLTQPFMMTGPYLAQHGVGLATKALAKAIPYAMGKKEITDPVLRQALQRASQEGIVDAQEIFHLYSVGAQGLATRAASALSHLPGVGSKIKAGSEDFRTRANAFLTLWGSMFSLAEGFNRKLTFIAAWEVAKGKGLKDPYAMAVRAVNETQGVYNKVNRPNWARGPAGRTILTFKQFSIMYVELLTRMATKGGPQGKKAALMMMAVLLLAAGESGLPFVEDIEDLIDTIGQGVFGWDTNSKRIKRRWAYNLLGKELGDLFLYGLSSHLPLDVSGRLGLGNLIPGTGLLKKSDETQRAKQMAEIFGAGAGMAGQLGDAYDAMVEGNTGKALQNLAPKAIKDVLASGEMAAKGYATDAKGRKVVDTNGLDAAVKAVGFQPTTVAQETRKTMPLYQDIALQKREKESITSAWQRAIVDGDEAGIAKAQARLDRWNEVNPDTPIVVKASQIRGGVRDLITDKDDRLLKKAPKEMRGRAGLDLLGGGDE